ncbi:hypothetical protein AVEN_237015-1 [Araneus ventricosus]|uniref:Uncharacterized protein n=1 Tax=Araneus ventricosus TaxID=182803 RepID=A0A4Y2QRR1_ARAVE|nr:hypothetical protein AVEN_237015-1 [Araneus ventricosus]
MPLFPTTLRLLHQLDGKMREESLPMPLFSQMLRLSAPVGWADGVDKKTAPCPVPQPPTLLHQVGCADGVAKPPHDPCSQPLDCCTSWMGR